VDGLVIDVRDREIRAVNVWGAKTQPTPIRGPYRCSVTLIAGAAGKGASGTGHEQGATDAVSGAQ